MNKAYPRFVGYRLEFGIRKLAKMDKLICRTLPRRARWCRKVCKLLPCDIHQHERIGVDESITRYLRGILFV